MYATISDMSSEQILTPDLVRQVLQETFPPQNDFYESNYVDELGELARFGVNSVDQLRSLLLKHKAEALEIDRSPPDPIYRQVHVEEHGEEWVAAQEKAGFWFALPALLRLVLELEFGAAYTLFADERDRG